MLLVSESEAKRNLAGLKKLAKNRDVVIVRDCDFQAALELMLAAKALEVEAKKRSLSAD